MSGFNIEFTHCSEVSETERVLAVIFVRCGTVEILACQSSSLLVVAVKERLAYIVEQVCRLFVHIPIVLRSTLCVGTTAPQGLFVECYALGFERTHNVCSYAAVANGQ